ncbi:hypothetical protein RB595_002700 [Gaeumannomyces hyphopodioides]
MSSSNKRHSVMPAAAQAGPKAPVIFSSSITIADQAMLSGMYPITVSSESVIHPRARFDSAGGPVNVGRRCIVHERAVLGAPGTNNHYVEGSVTLADLVTVEAAAVVECGGTYVGEGTTVGVGCRIGAGASIGKHCTLTPMSTVASGEKIPDFTVIYSNGMRRIDKRNMQGLRNPVQSRHIDVLRRLIPSNPAKFQ